MTSCPYVVLRSMILFGGWKAGEEVPVCGSPALLWYGTTVVSAAGGGGEKMNQNEFFV